MYTNKGFTGNDGTSAIDWDPTEVQHFQDLENTLVSDALGGVKDTNGHKHANLYHTTSQAGITLFDGQVTISALGNSQLVVVNPTSNSGVSVGIMFSYNDNANSSVIEAQNENLLLYSGRSVGNLTLGVTDETEQPQTVAITATSTQTTITFSESVLFTTPGVVNISATSTGNSVIYLNTIDTDGGLHSLNFQGSSGAATSIVSNESIELLCNTSLIVTSPHLIVNNLPTSSSGLPLNCLWSDSGTVKVTS